MDKIKDMKQRDFLNIASQHKFNRTTLTKDYFATRLRYLVNYHGSRSELDPWRLLLMLNNPTAFAAAYALVPSSVSSVLL